jgi:hypothetical protein
VKRALVVGSQIEGLRGVHMDATSMQALLEARGFEVELRIEARASRAGILAGYDKLIVDSEPGDAAVVYYSGHGFYGTVAGPERQSWQCLVPTDLRDGTTTDWRGITAWELSVKQAQLTRKTKNVTVILDACHSAQMSRDAAVRDAVPRALPHPVELGFTQHVQRLRSVYAGAADAIDSLGNRDAVRLVACGQLESAFEYRDANGDYRGAFTHALIEVLDQVGDAQISWAQLRDAIRARVLRNFAMQRPDVEGPARRRLFSLIEDDEHGIVAFTQVDDRFQLPVGRLTGVGRGDTYAVMPVGSARYEARRAIARLEVVEVNALTATARRTTDARPIPPDAVAIPLTRTATRRLVAVDAVGPARDAIAKAVAASPTLGLTEPGDPAALATLRLVGDALTIEDAWGPLFPPAAFSDELAATVKNVANLGVAQAVRELEGEHGVSGHEVEIEIGTVEHGRGIPLAERGAALGLADRLYVKVASKAQRRLFAHVFNIGVRGKVTLLTPHAPTGVVLDAGGPPLVLGRSAQGTLTGLRLIWPDRLPRGSFPRIDEVIVIVTTAAVNLHDFETQERLPAHRGRASQLQATLTQMYDGAGKEIELGAELDGFLVRRLSYLLHPRDAAMRGLVFQVDDNPSGQAAACEPDAWIAPGLDVVTRSGTRGGASEGDAPAAIAIRLTDLIVENNRAMFSADIRIDALVCTRAGGPGEGHATWTQKYENIKDGQRLPLENGLVFLGPVRDFVDITLFVSRDTAGSLELAKLLAARATSPDFRDAAGTLLVAAGVAAAPWVTAVGASTVLARMAYELVVGVAGASIGLYRTSFLRRERFGVGRHPAHGLYRAQDFSFGLAIEPVELQRAPRRS